MSQREISKYATNKYPPKWLNQYFLWTQKQGIHREDQAKKNQIQDLGVQSDGTEGESQSGLIQTRTAAPREFCWVLCI